MSMTFSAPPSLPLGRVRFEFIILSTRGEPIADDEFAHHLVMSERGRALSREARLLLQRDCLKLRCERRRFVEGRAQREPEVFRACRRLANIGQINMAPNDHDLINIGRGAFRVEYDGPAAHNQAQLELMVQAAETVRALRPGLVVDHAARQIWGAHSWDAQLTRHGGLGAREHFKIEMGQSRQGIGLSTRGLSKFGLPDLRMEALPHDLSGIAAISMTSIALDLVHAEGGIDASRGLKSPVVRGEFYFHYQAAGREEGYPGGVFRMSGGVDGDEPSHFGLIEILSRLRRRYVDGETFHEGAQPDATAIRQAQAALPRFKEKFQLFGREADRAFLVQARAGFPSDSWIIVTAIAGSRILGAAADPPPGDPEPDRTLAVDQAEICDWLILRGGDIEDGGFGIHKPI